MSSDGRPTDAASAEAGIAALEGLSRRLADCLRAVEAAHDDCLEARCREHLEELRSLRPAVEDALRAAVPLVTRNAARQNAPAEVSARAEAAQGLIRSSALAYGRLRARVASQLGGLTEQLRAIDRGGKVLRTYARGRT